MEKQDATKQTRKVSFKAAALFPLGILAVGATACVAAIPFGNGLPSIAIGMITLTVSAVTAVGSLVEYRDIRRGREPETRMVYNAQRILDGESRGINRFIARLRCR